MRNSTNQLSNVVGTVLPAFQKRLLHLKPIWIPKPGRFPPLSVQPEEIYVPIGAKDLTLPVEIQKAFGV
jgi:hypothetical protein